MSTSDAETTAGLSRRGLLTGAAALGAIAASQVAAGSADASPAAAKKPVKPIGFVLSHEQFRSQSLVDFAVAAEAAGFRSVWASDHLQPWQHNEGHAMFPWQTLALAGQRTSRLVYGTGVTCPTYRHHPTQVAQAFASLAVLNPGRVFLGVGTGEALNEKAATGQFGRYPERAARLSEAVTLIRRLWTGEKVSFKGHFYRTDSLKLWDLPKHPVPIYIAASGPKSAYLAGFHGDGWITSSGDFMKKALREAFDRGARAAGKDPAKMPKLVETFVVVGGRAEAEYAATRWRFTVKPFGDLVYVPDPDRIQHLAAQRWTLKQVYERWPVSVDPRVHLKALEPLLKMGATPYIHSGQADQHRVIDFYRREVLPHLH